MKTLLKHLFFTTLLFHSLFVSAQVSGSPGDFRPNDELTIGFHFDLDKIEDEQYLYTLIPLLNGDYFTAAVSWTTLSTSEFEVEPAILVDEEGNTRVNPVGFFSIDPTIIRVVATDPEYRGLVGTHSVNTSQEGGFENIFGGDVV